jgi:hypothetical protein
MPLQTQPYFTYLPLEAGHVRFLRLEPGKHGSPLHGQLSPSSLGDWTESSKKKFTALSYVWGPTSVTRRWMKIDGFMFHIRPNLFEALQAARSLLEKKPEVSRLLWIDAICVNQEDIPERNAQVAKMGRIYRDANHVLAWLGQRTKDSEVAFLSLMTLHEYEIRALAPPARVRIPAEQAVRALCQREYWGRAWTQQEIALGKRRMLLMCGDTWMHFNFMSLLRLLDYSVLEGTGAALALQDVEKRSLEDLITGEHMMFQCSDVRDRIFSMLSIASDGDGEWGADYDISISWLHFGIIGVCKSMDPNWLAVCLVLHLETRRSTIEEFLALDAPVYESKLLARSRPQVSSSVWKRQGLDFIESIRNLEKPELSSFITADSPVVRFRVANDTSQVVGWDIRPGDAILLLEQVNFAAIYRPDVLGGVLIGFAQQTVPRTWEQSVPNAQQEDAEMEKVADHVRLVLGNQIPPAWEESDEPRNLLAMFQNSHSVQQATFQRLRLSGDLCIASLCRISRLLNLGRATLKRVGRTLV